MAREGREVVRVEFEPGKTKKFIPKAKHLFAARKASGMSVGDMCGEWEYWPFLIRALLLETDSTITHDEACDLMDTYFETHDGEPDAMKKLGRAIGMAVQKYVQIEMKQTPDEQVADARPTPPSNG